MSRLATTQVGESEPATEAMTPARLPNDVGTIQHKRLLGLIAVSCGLLVVCGLSLCVGTELVSPSTTWSALTHYTDTGEEWIVRDLRIPRTLLGLTVGIALGTSGALIQSVARNPLADTQILGINSGASLAVVTAVAFLGLHSVWAYIWFAFAGAFIAMIAVYLVGMTGRAVATPVRILLAGVAIGAIMDGISFTIRLRRPRAFDSMRFWDAGALDNRPLSVVAAVAPFVAVGLVLCVVVSRSLNAVAMGDDIATAMGSNVARTQALALIAVTVLAGAAVAGAGPIGFIGLMVPHAVRRLTGPDWRWILAYAVVAAPALLMLADILGRLIIRPAELPAGLVTAFVGAPVLIWLVRRNQTGGM